MFFYSKIRFYEFSQKLKKRELRNNAKKPLLSDVELGKSRSLEEF